SIEIPPHGGDTLFSDQAAAFAALPDKKKDYLRGLTAIHSASRGYAPDGLYGDNDKGRSMAIKPSEAALARHPHPLVKRHSETDEEVLFCSVSYVVGIDGMNDEAALQLVLELHQWCEQDQFVYRHRWDNNMLVMWDNRCVNHKATGGYEGYRRELHRTTIKAAA
ncbi:MAG: TauD/TfdA family dioxygenase, partial [Pseudomonadota bacterium]